MKLNMFGSHNSWTFRKPIKWYLKHLCFIAQCQDVDTDDTYLFYDFVNIN